MSVLCHAGSLRCTCGQAANGYPPKREEAEMYPNSWMCPNGNHTFTWTSSTSSSRTGQPSGFCRCGQFYYDANEKRVTMMYFPGYHPAGYRQAKPDPPLEVSLPQMQGAQRAGASHLSADGKLAYRDDRGNPEIAHWDVATGMYGSWWACEGLPAEAVRLEPFD